MRRSFTYKQSWIVIIAIAIFMNFVLINTVAYSQSDTTYVHMLRPKQSKNYLKSSLHLVLPPLKPAVISTQKVNVYKADDKLLNNVQVFPNPLGVSDQLSLKYELTRYSNVTIKIVDVLGNDIVTLFNQRLDPGEKTYSYNLNNKLPRGFYFVRIIAGTETVIKRISVL